MTRKEAIKTVKENYCALCAYGAQNMDTCDISSCDNKDAIKALDQEPCEDCISRRALQEWIKDKSFGDIVVASEHNFDCLPPVTPQPATARRIVGKSRGGMTLWYQCEICNEPIDDQDTFCRGCGRKLVK